MMIIALTLSTDGFSIKSAAEAVQSSTALVRQGPDSPPSTSALPAHWTHFFPKPRFCSVPAGRPRLAACWGHRSWVYMASPHTANRTAIQ